MKRENWIDVARGIGILLVVIGHCHRPELLLKLIQSFHMPLFFIISGYLFTPRGRAKEFASHKAKLYLKPYFKLAFVNYIIWMAIKYFEIGFTHEYKLLAVRYLIGIAYSRGTWYWMPNCSAIWFLTALLLATLIMYFITKANKPTQIVLVVICGIMAYLICKLDVFNNPVTTLLDFKFERIKLPWNLDSALWGVVFMYFGYMARSHSLMDKISQLGKAKSTVIAIVLLIIGLIFAIINKIDFMSMDSMICGNIIYSYISSLGISFALFIFVNTFIPNSKSLAFLGRNTIPILGYNYLVNYFVYFLWDKVFGEAEFTGDWAIQCILQIALLSLLAFILYQFKVAKKKIKESKNEA